VDRIQTYSAISTQLTKLTDESLLTLLEKAKPLHIGIDGKSFELTLGENRIFVKKIPLSDLEMAPENAKSTANLNQLPLFCHYGIGGPGFGSWRELAANQSATQWVLSNQCENFSLLYHWRVIAVPRANPMNDEQLKNLEKQVQFWENSSSVRDRYIALHNPAAEIIMFLEFVPHTLLNWLKDQCKLGLETFDKSLAFVDESLKLTVAFMKKQGLVHFDTHFENILTDGHRLYFNDFGLALSSDFDLNEEEARFLADHQDYDLWRASIGFMHALVTSALGDKEWKENLRMLLRTRSNELTPTGHGLLTQYGPLALELLEFSRKLNNESKRTPYPAQKLSRLIGQLR
jgi:serine/threonine protein kinase